MFWIILYMIRRFSDRPSLKLIIQVKFCVMLRKVTSVINYFSSKLLVMYSISFQLLYNFVNFWKPNPCLYYDGCHRQCIWGYRLYCLTSTDLEKILIQKLEHWNWTFFPLLSTFFVVTLNLIYARKVDSEYSPRISNNSFSKDLLS